MAAEQSVSPRFCYICRAGIQVDFGETVLGVGLDALALFSTAMELAMSWSRRYYTNALSPGDASREFNGNAFPRHRLSDLIGFTYGSMQPKRAAADRLVGAFEA